MLPFILTLYYVLNPQPGIAPDSFEALRPKFGILTNSPTDYQVMFKAFDSKSWTVVTNHFPDTLAAELTIDLSLMDMEISYRVMNAIKESLDRR